MTRVEGYSTYDIRVRAVNAVKDGMSVSEVAKAYQTHRATIYRWSERYRRCRGVRGLVRKPVSGRPRKLTELSGRKLRSIVLKPASKFGYETDFWTCSRLLQVFQKELRVRVSKMTIWRRLRDVGLTYQKPERRYFEIREKDRQDWVKNELPKIRAAVKKYRAILYFEDEANISLTAFLGKTWAPRGKTPTQRVTGKRCGVAAMSAITKNGQLIFRLPPETDGTQPTQVGENSRPPTDLLELVNHYPGKQLCWASDLAEDDGDKAE